MRRCSGPSAKGVVGLFLFGRQGAEPPTPAHAHIAIGSRDFRTSGETGDCEKRSFDHQFTTRSPAQITETPTPEFRSSRSQTTKFQTMTATRQLRQGSTKTITSDLDYCLLPFL